MADSTVLARKIRMVFAPRPLGRWPTPLADHPELARASALDALWIKREDLSATAFGGNKVRGLEFLFVGAAPGSVFVTVGGVGSTHCLATAVHAAVLSCRTVLAQFPQPETQTVQAVAAACERAAARVVRAGSLAGVPLAVLSAWRHARRLGPTRWIPGGGAKPRAVLGHVLAGLELGAQLASEPQAIVTPLGSGGTAAGLLVALRLLEWRTRVVAVRVAPALVANRWRVSRLARAAIRELERVGVSVPGSHVNPPLIIDGLGHGYGYPSAEGEAARTLAARHGLVLDSTYGAKTFAALPALGARGFRRVVFWHTFALPPRTDPERAA